MGFKGLKSKKRNADARKRENNNEVLEVKELIILLCITPEIVEE